MTPELEQAAERREEMSPTEAAAIWTKYQRENDYGDEYYDVVGVLSDWAAARLLADAKAAEMDETPIDLDWLVSIGFQESTLFYTLLIPPVGDAAIMEVCIGEDSTGWTVSLCQGYPDEPNGSDDHVLLTGKEYKTRGAVLQLLRALGIEPKGVTRES